MSGVVMSWNLDAVRRKFAQKHPHADLGGLEREYRRYMAMLVANPGVKFPMSEPVDEFAHQHMLFLGDFRSFERSLGGEINHEPTFNKEDEDCLLPDYLGLTIEVYRNMFGEEPPEQFWPKTRAVCYYDLDVRIAT